MVCDVRTIIVLVLFVGLLLVGCRSVQVAAYPAVVVYEHGFARQLSWDRRGNAILVDKTTNFTQDDEYIYSYVSAAFYSANLTWTWYDPGEELYRAISYDTECVAAPCRFTAALSMADTPAAARLGLWRMELLADGFPLYSDYFRLSQIMNEDNSWFFDVYAPAKVHVNVTVGIHPQNPWSNYRIGFGMAYAPDINAYEIGTNQSLPVTYIDGVLTVDFAKPRSNGYAFGMSFNFENFGFRVTQNNLTWTEYNLTWREYNRIHPIPQKFVIAIPEGAALECVVGPANYTLGSKNGNASRTLVFFNQTLAPYQMFAFSITYLIHHEAATKVVIVPSTSPFDLQLPLLPLKLGDITAWSAGMSIILIATTEILSPYYSRSGIVLNRRRLRFASYMLVALFLVSVFYGVYQMIVIGH